MNRTKRGSVIVHRNETLSECETVFVCVPVSRTHMLPSAHRAFKGKGLETTGTQLQPVLQTWGQDDNQPLTASLPLLLGQPVPGAGKASESVLFQQRAPVCLLGGHSGLTQEKFTKFSSSVPGVWGCWSCPAHEDKQDDAATGQAHHCPRPLPTGIAHPLGVIRAGGGHLKRRR